MPDPKLRHLRIEGVSKSFGGQVALSDFHLDVLGGEFVALLGPSGCGKSTMLNCLAGLLPLGAGRITLDDRRIDTLPPERRGFGMVFQNYALFPHLTVRRNVAFGLHARKTPSDEVGPRVERSLEQVRLTEHADRYPSQLSGGQQQRVAMARAIVLEPPLILMDEPLSNLDAQLRTELRTELRRLHQDLGLTTVYVTHDQSEALSLADRIVILRSGRMLQVGTPEEVYTQPAGAYVAAFMGYRNLLPAQLKEARDGRATVLLAGGQVELDGVDRTGDGVGDLVAAIRPEDLRVGGGSGGDGDRNLIRCRAEVVEYQGNELVVTAEAAAGLSLQLRTRERVAPGDELSVRADPARVLVFEAAS
ncbi:ABC transporter ATP-binding protein [soil metagenome]|jgi:putative spermidine/putrescine transport system ATP-binding protein|nr:ABC transporter ATP-binding protein [Euzebyaceae bacterium]